MSKILLILGSGPRIGAATATKFSTLGYTVITASRSAKEGNHVQVDLSKPETVEAVFEEVTKKWGNPSVVLYNAGTHVPAKNPLDASLGDFTTALNIISISAFAAASAAWKRNPKVTIFYTGNVTNEKPLPGMSIMGVGKSATAYWIKEAAAAGTRIYYVDQRKLDGSPAYVDVNGPAHADVFARLAESPEREDPIVVFRAGLGQ